MKKILSLILAVLCVFSLNFCFKVSSFAAPEAPINKELPELPMDGKVDDDILREPIFDAEKKQPKKNKFLFKVGNAFLRVLLGAALLVVAIFCCSFVWFVNLKRKKDAQRRKQSSASNVIDAIDNFARHRIK